MSDVAALGYLVLGASDVGGTTRVLTDVLGMQETTNGRADGARLLRVDERSLRITVEPGQDRTGVIGWETGSPAALERIVDKLERAGVATKPDTSLAKDRNVTAVVTASDPGGQALEFFYGARVDRRPFVSPTGVRFVTGDMGLGHVVQFVPDVAEALEFYQGLLGFRMSDSVSAGPATVYFLRCNARHHSLALASVPGMGAALQHFMVEVDALDDVGRALDLVLDGAAPLAATLGRHTNDHMVSFFLMNANGVMIEYGWGGRRVDEDTWSVERYTEGSFWGLKPVGPMPVEP